MDKLSNGDNQSLQTLLDTPINRLSVRDRQFVLSVLLKSQHEIMEAYRKYMEECNGH